MAATGGGGAGWRGGAPPRRGRAGCGPSPRGRPTRWAGVGRAPARAGGETGVGQLVAAVGLGRPPHERHRQRLRASSVVLPENGVGGAACSSGRWGPVADGPGGRRAWGCRRRRGRWAWTAAEAVGGGRPAGASSSTRAPSPGRRCGGGRPRGPRAGRVLLAGADGCGVGGGDGAVAGAGGGPAGRQVGGRGRRRRGATTRARTSEAPGRRDQVEVQVQRRGRARSPGWWRCRPPGPRGRSGAGGGGRRRGRGPGWPWWRRRARTGPSRRPGRRGCRRRRGAGRRRPGPGGRSGRRCRGRCAAPGRRGGAGCWPARAAGGGPRRRASSAGRRTKSSSSSMRRAAAGRGRPAASRGVPLVRQGAAPLLVTGPIGGAPRPAPQDGAGRGRRCPRTRGPVTQRSRTRALVRRSPARRWRRAARARAAQGRSGPSPRRCRRRRPRGRGSGARRPGRRSIVERVHERVAGGQVSSAMSSSLIPSRCLTRARSELPWAATSIDPPGPEVGDDAVDPVRQRPLQHVLQALGPGQRRRAAGRRSGGRRRRRRSSRARSAPAACRSCGARRAPWASPYFATVSFLSSPVRAP